MKQTQTEHLNNNNNNNNDFTASPPGNRNMKKSGSREEIAGTGTSLIAKYRPKTFKPYTYLNPFIYDNSLNIFDDPFERYKIYAMSVILVPIRVLGIVISLFVTYMFAAIGQFSFNTKKKPLNGWRFLFQQLTANAMRQIYSFGSVHYCKVIGEKASVKDAPVIVVAPHSTYVDSLSIIKMGPPSIVAKQDTAEIPFFGKIVNNAQPIYVRREDPESRQNTIKQIIDRVNSEENWPQTAIFPEGTCTNRKALITFKSGAFYPGVAVQPVILKYPNKYDTLTWTWKGPPILKLVWATLAQFYTRAEIEYLPVYKPSEEEKKNPQLFAENVRAVMAKALNIPISDYSMDDSFYLQEATKMNTPFYEDIVEIERCLNHLLLSGKEIDETIARQLTSLPSTFVDIFEFSKMLNISHEHEYTHRLFSLLKPNTEEKIDLKDFLLCSFFVRKVNDPIIEYLRLVAQVYWTSRNEITREELKSILRHCHRFQEDSLDQIFLAIDFENKGHISFDDFEVYTKDKPQYQFLYQAKRQIRRY